MWLLTRTALRARERMGDAPETTGTVNVVWPVEAGDREDVEPETVALFSKEAFAMSSETGSEEIQVHNLSGENWNVVWGRKGHSGR